MKYIMSIGTINKENAVILDFFAGSGTTGQALFRYNAENKKSNRRIILCTNNENNICKDVTYERLKRVIEKEKYVESLKYYKIDYIPISDRLYYEYADELLLHIRELVELENGIDFINNSEIAIILTEKEADDYINRLNKDSDCKIIYLGHDILLSGEQAEKVRKLNIKINNIPDYYYRELEG